MFDMVRNQVRKRVEQAGWMPSELRAFALEKVELDCQFLTPGKAFFLCTNTGGILSVLK
jgi:hypothetical protein